MDREEALQTDFETLLDLDRDPSTFAFFRLIVGDYRKGDMVSEREFNIGTCVRVCYGVFATCTTDCRDEVIQMIYDICAGDRCITDLFYILKENGGDMNAVNAYGNTCIAEIYRLFREPNEIVKYLVEECAANIDTA